jgi:hypothetical protein
VITVIGTLGGVGLTLGAAHFSERSKRTSERVNLNHNDRKEALLRVLAAHDAVTQHIKREESAFAKTPADGSDAAAVGRKQERLAAAIRVLANPVKEAVVALGPLDLYGNAEVRQLGRELTQIDIDLLSALGMGDERELEMQLAHGLERRTRYVDEVRLDLGLALQGRQKLRRMWRRVS